MNIREWLRKELSVISEDYRFQYDNEVFVPTPSVIDAIAKAYEYIKTNNLVGGTGGNEGSGLKKALHLLQRQPVTHAQLKRMKAFFDNNYEEAQKEKSAGKDITNSPVLQSWELWGGDYGREWVNNKIKTVQDGNKRSKELRPKGHKRMMDPYNTRIQDGNTLYKSTE